MRVSKYDILQLLPEETGDWVLINPDQETRDIIQEMVDAHIEFAHFYDLFAMRFDAPTVEKICENLYNFCLENIRYREESANDQTTALPTGILQRGYGDCKHYASFCAGVLDSISRQTGKKIYWHYCFASYELLNQIPYHVFVVVDDRGTPLWIDPTPGSDGKVPVWIINRTVEAAKPAKVAGFGNSVGAAVEPEIDPGTCEVLQAGEIIETGPTGQQTITQVGSALVMIGTVLDATIVGSIAGVIVQAVGILVGLAGRFLGNKWHTSTQVRWLIKHFQYSVLGQANVTSDNKVDENLLQDTLNWFTAVLGVPIYDDDRLQVLSGNDFNGHFLDNTYEDRAAEYLKFWDAKEAGVTFERALAAAHAADGLRLTWQFGAGAWANAPVSDYWIAKGCQKAAEDNTPMGKVKAFLQEHKKIFLIGGGVLLLWGIYEATKKTKKAG